MGWGWELLDSRDEVFVCLGLGLSEDQRARLSTSVMVPKPWSMASPSFSFGIWSEVWVRDGERDAGTVGPEYRMKGLLPPSCRSNQSTTCEMRPWSWLGKSLQSSNGMAGIEVRAGPVRGPAGAFTPFVHWMVVCVMGQVT